MFESITSLPTVLARNRYDIVDFVKDLWNGEPMGWLALAVVGGCIAFFVIYKKVTGEDFVKSRNERREARNRRKHVLWEYKRDD